MLLTRRHCLTAIVMLAASGCKLSRGAQTPAPTSGGTDGSAGKASEGMKPSKLFRPEEFGAIGDGKTNDTAAFARMSAAVNASGGGLIVLSPTTYIVGQQVADPRSVYAFPPAPIMDLLGCNQPLTIIGNGARLRCADGLRFGTFDRQTGAPTNHPMPFYGVDEVASPYLAMISVENCTGKISIENLELDGNMDGLILGGRYGDTGWQIPAIGLRLLDNRGGERVVKVYTHHHAQDGLYIDGVVDGNSSSTIQEVVSEYNGRQGCSLVGGRSHRFVDCRFNHTGRSRIMSAPGAGVDLEAEIKTIRDVSFSGCEFVNNAGVGMVADTGDTEGATFDNCRFVGTDAWAAWPKKPRFQFSDCQFVGAIVQTFAGKDPSCAAKFLRCSFTDDKALTPTGQAYGPSIPIADLGSGDENVLFDRCRFDLKHASILPWTVSAIFNDCTMSQLSEKQAYPRGTFTGVNTIYGNVDLYGSKFLGQLYLNGKLFPAT